MKKVLLFVVLYAGYGNLFATQELQELVDGFCKFMKGEITANEQKTPSNGDLDRYEGRLPFARDLKVYEQNSSGFYYEAHPTLSAFVGRLEESRKCGKWTYTFEDVKACDGGVTIQGSLSNEKGFNLVVCYKLYFEEGQLIYKIERSARVQKKQ